MAIGYYIEEHSHLPKFVNFAVNCPLPTKGSKKSRDHILLYSPTYPHHLDQYLAHNRWSVIIY